MSLSGGESRKLTSAEEGVARFAWSHNGKRIAFVASEPKTEAMKERQKLYGDVTIEDEATNPAHLHVITVDDGVSKRLTSGTFVVGAFDWSPDDREIAFDFTQSTDPSFGVTSNISVVDTDSATVRALVNQDGPDGDPRYSPDGKLIAFATAMQEVASFYYRNGKIATIPAAGGTITPITSAFDEDPRLVAWTRNGIFLAANQKTEAGLFKVEPAGKTVARVPLERAIAPGSRSARTGRISPSSEAPPASTRKCSPARRPEGPRRSCRMWAATSPPSPSGRAKWFHGRARMEP